MKRSIFLTTILLASVVCATAQEILTRLTEFKEFRPAIVYMADGKKVTLPHANIFLKNSSLLYLSNDGIAMEADMKPLMRVDFQDRMYFRIDSTLAYRVDTLDDNALYCARVIDLKAYRQAVKNNTNITNLDLSFNTMLNYTTVEVNEEEGLPIIPRFYYRLDGKYVLAHERHLKRILNKEKRRRMESVMSLPGFSWTDEKWLMEVLKAIR